MAHRDLRWVIVGTVALTVGLGLATVSQADEQSMMKQKQREGETSLKQSDRSEAGINDGGQAIPPGEGEQTGRPGTIGAPATLPPDDQSPGYEGADKQQKNKEQESKSNQ